MSRIISTIGSQKVVEPEEVEAYTQSGWRIRSMFQTSVAVRYMAKASGVASQSNNWVPEQPQYQETVGLVTRFIMVRDRDDDMTELREQLVKAQETSASAERARFDAEARATKAAEAQGAAQKQASEMSAREDAATKRAGLVEQRARKAEADLAKIRGALGDIGMKEILGS